MQLGMAHRKNEGALTVVGGKRQYRAFHCRIGCCSGRGVELTTVLPITALDLDAAATGIPAKFYGENSIAISANNVDCRSASVNAI
jgi:hypothetical protein